MCRPSGFSSDDRSHSALHRSCRFLLFLLPYFAVEYYLYVKSLGKEGVSATSEWSPAVEVVVEKAPTFVEKEIYKTEFNYALPSNPTYDSATYVSGEDTDGKEWVINYGNWAGSNSAQFRIYSGASGGFGQLYNKFDLNNVTKITYSAKKTTTKSANPKLNTYYSTDSGNTWIAVDTDKELTTTATTYTINISNTGVEKVRVKFELSSKSTRPSSKNAQLTIDDVVFYGMVQE